MALQCHIQCPKWPIQFLYLRGILVIIGGFIVELSLGSIYTYGNMTLYIVSYIRNQSHPADLKQELSMWIFGTTILGEGLASVIGGFLVGKIGPRWTSLIGSWLFNLGLGLSYFTIRISFWLLLLTYGFMLGVGVGIGYMGPISAAMKWMPHWKGLASGIVIAGYGLSNLIFGFVQTKIINPNNIQASLDDQGNYFFVDPDLLNRIPPSFIILSVTHTIIQLIGSLLITDPPEGYNTEQNTSKLDEYHEVDDTTEIIKVRSMWGAAISCIKSIIKFKSFSSHDRDIKSDKLSSDDEESSSSALIKGEAMEEGSEELQLLRLEVQEKESSKSQEKKNPSYSPIKIHNIIEWDDDDVIHLTPLQMLRRPYFYVICAMFLVNMTAIVFITAFYKYFGLLSIRNDLFLTIIGSVGSIFNAVGRMFWGLMADRLSHKLALVLLSSIFTIFLLTFYITTIVHVTTTKVMFTIWIAVIFLCIGGNFSVFPATIGQVYGLKYVAINYSILNSFKVLAGPLAAALSTIFATHYFYLLLFLSCLSGTSFILSIIYKPKLYVTLKNEK